jgi:hypothetical protein
MVSATEHQYAVKKKKGRLQDLRSVQSTTSHIPYRSTKQEAEPNDICKLNPAGSLPNISLPSVNHPHLSLYCQPHKRVHLTQR